MTTTLPAGWKEGPLRDVADLVGGGTPDRSTARYFGGDTPWVTPSDLPPIGEVCELGEVKETISEAGLQNSSAKLLPPNSVLFSSRASIGKIAVSNRPCATNQGFANLVPRNGILDPWFLAYYLAHATPQILQLAGETTYKEVSRGKLKEFPILLPPLSEQRRIVERIKECLSRVDEIKRLKEEVRQEAEALIRARRHEVWLEWSSHKKHMVPFGAIVESFKNGLYKPAKFYGQGMLLLRMYNIGNQGFSAARFERVKATPEERDKYAVATGDLLISRVNSRELVGKSAVVPELREPAVFEAMLIRVHLDRGKAVPEFVAEMLNSPECLTDLRGKAKHAIGQSSLNQQDISSVLLPLPEIRVQKKLAEEFSYLQCISTELRQEIAEGTLEINRMTRAVLSKAFAGEL